MHRISAKVIAQQINQLIPNIKSGTLRFYGEWFGRPMDNNHRIIRADYQEQLLLIYFDNNETLYIKFPEDVLISQEIFIIKNSKGLIWQWYYYGSEQINKNLRAYNYIVNNEAITSIKLEGHILNKVADENQPAIEIC
ncbi:hypothetical protein ABEV74_01620 [Paenibacillus cisolokensis]|uniref:hypothetical protein n=1 Tax=Paenibacillus cisolokensis TaxID=1658519 RepID=UPI003D2A9C8A